TGSKRLAVLPDVPTMAQAGFPDFDLYEWFGLVLPAGTPAEIGLRLGREIERFVRRPEILGKAEGLGLELVFQSPAEFRQYIEDENKRGREIVRDGKIQLD